MKLYRYVGPRQIADRVRLDTTGFPVHSLEDVLVWARATRQECSAGGIVTTFVVDAAGVLLIADRRSEHVTCAGGRPVRSAGEMTFAVGRTVEVMAVSNQSTGYCTEPESWPAVAAALVSAGFEPLAGFSPACQFRRCVRCGSLTLVKGAVFECGVCEAELPTTYNCQDPGDGGDRTP